MASQQGPEPGSVMLQGNVCHETHIMRHDENVSRILFWRVGEKKGIIYGPDQWFEKTKAANPQTKIRFYTTTKSPQDSRLLNWKFEIEAICPSNFMKP
jgi:uncharacterized protein (DUF924 family)